MEIQKFEYLKNEESFLDEIKSIFHNFKNALYTNAMININVNQEYQHKKTSCKFFLFSNKHQCYATICKQYASSWLGSIQFSDFFLKSKIWSGYLKFMLTSPCLQPGQNIAAHLSIFPLRKDTWVEV